MTTLRKITGRKELIDWLVDEVLKAEPRVEISTSFVELLNRFATHFSEHSLWSTKDSEHDFVSWAMDILSRPGERILCGEGLVPLVTDIFGEMVVIGEGMDFGQFIEKLAAAADLEEAILVTTGGGHWHVTSSLEFDIRRDGLSLSVAVPLTDHEG